MWHTNDDALDPMLDTPVNECLHAGNQSLASLEPESFFRRELVGDILLKEFGPHKSVEDHALFVNGVVPWARNLDTFPDPITLVFVRDMDVFNTNVTAWIMINSTPLVTRAYGIANVQYIRLH